jgi:hypothetical protein
MFINFYKSTPDFDSNKNNVLTLFNIVEDKFEISFVISIKLIIPLRYENLIPTIF